MTELLALLEASEVKIAMTTLVRKLCAKQFGRSEEHTSELQSPVHLVCRLLLEKNNRLPYSLPGRAVEHPPCLRQVLWCALSMAFAAVADALRSPEVFPCGNLGLHARCWSFTVA